MRTVAVLVLGIVVAAMSLAALGAGPVDTVTPTPPDRIPVSSDRDVLGASAVGKLLAVERDPDGQLVMIVPAEIDPSTLEQRYPPPATMPPGSGAVLGIGAALVLLSGTLRALGRPRASRWLGGLTAGVLGGVGAVGLSADAPPTIPVVVLLCAVTLLALITGGVRRQTRGYQ